MTSDRGRMSRDTVPVLWLAGALGTGKSEVELHTRLVPDATWTVCRLRIGARGRRKRTSRRGALLGLTEEDVDHAVAAGVTDEAYLETQTFAHLVLDTDGLDQRAVVDLVLSTTGWPGERGGQPPK